MSEITPNGVLQSDTSSSSPGSVARRCAEEASSRKQHDVKREQRNPLKFLVHGDPFRGRHASCVHVARRQTSAVHVKMYHEGRDPCQEESLASCWLPLVVK